MICKSPYHSLIIHTAFVLSDSIACYHFIKLNYHHLEIVKYLIVDFGWLSEFFSQRFLNYFGIFYFQELIFYNEVLPRILIHLSEFLLSSCFPHLNQSFLIFSSNACCIHPFRYFTFFFIFSLFVELKAFADLLLNFLSFCLNNIMFGYFLVTAIIFLLSFTHYFSEKHQLKLGLKSGLKRPCLKFLIFLKISKIGQICIFKNLSAYIWIVVWS